MELGAGRLGAGPLHFPAQQILKFKIILLRPLIKFALGGALVSRCNDWAEVAGSKPADAQNF